jgi:hypothetical protein
MSGRLLSTFETVGTDTWACAATSATVGDGVVLLAIAAPYRNFYAQMA